MIGSGAILVAPVTIGAGAFVGANTVVPKGRDVEEGQTVVGVPARPLHSESEREGHGPLGSGEWRVFLQNAFRLSRSKVTGPSLTSSTFIIARNVPVATATPDARI